MTYHFNFDQLRNLSIGTVDYVSPNEIKVLLETDAPQNTALNTGVPSLFPRINGFVLIPNEVGALVGIINWLGVEHSQYPKRKGFKDYDLIDLPFPLRKMAINPIGTLKTEIKDKETIYKLERGVYSFPSIGDTVILPKDEQLRSIVENDDEKAFVKIGRAPIAGNAIVRINPDKLFGRHVAVLGNTGSGKSCSVAGLIRWSLEEAEKHKIAELDKLNTRFIVLDPNGEYSNSFSDLNADVKLFKVEITEEEVGAFKQLKVPAWFWNSYEWGSFLIASGKTQKPILRQALRDLKNGGASKADDELMVFKRQLSSSINLFESQLRNTNSFKAFPGTKNTYALINSFAQDFNSNLGKFDGTYDAEIQNISTIFTQIGASRYSVSNNGFENFAAFAVADIERIIFELKTLVALFGGPVSYEGPNEDSPVFFDVEGLPDYIEILAKDGNAIQHLEFFIMRLRSMLADVRLKKIIGNDDDVTLTDWLEEYVSGVVVIDLSLIPSDIIHLAVAVISRMTFEAIQRYRRKTGKVLPTVITLEEAHNFIKKYNESDEVSATEICSQVFEKIAREGRKFGLSMMISSQRPSELSATILSQCNTFLLHRIVNDRDQDLIRRLVPDNIGGLLSELPILPTRKAILLGWASPIPILIEMNDLAKKYRPKSDDPDFWDVWTGASNRDENWADIVNEWQGQTTMDDPLAESNNAIIEDQNNNEDEDDDLPF
jgi:DNA helicase HerA-like ATPase